jgi:hypothetical protein
MMFPMHGLTGACPFAVTWASTKSAIGHVTRATTNIITRTAATSLPAELTKNVRRSLNDPPITDLKLTVFSVSGTTAPKILGISGHCALENVALNGR